MKLLKKLAKPEIFLRLGLGSMFLYSGYSMYSNPGPWEFYVSNLPEWALAPVTNFVTIQQFLMIQSIAEMAFGAVLILWFLPLWLTRMASILITLHLAAIIMLVGIDTTTFRDIGLLGAALALISVLYRKT
jgi:hypothetical protein